MFGFNKKYNVLVLGNNGMLGYDVYNELVFLSSIKHSNIGTVIGLDVGDGIKLDERYSLDDYMESTIHFDYCINCVAYTNTKDAETTKEGRELDYRLNALVPKYVAEACKRNKTKLIHISTDYVFSENSPSCAYKFNNSPIPFIPSAEPFPCNIYGYDKLLGERNIESVFGKNSKDYCILRVSWLYGSHNNKSFIHKFLKNVYSALKEGSEMTMTSNEISVPTSTEYVVGCIKQAISYGAYGIFHAVPNGEATRFEFSSAILDSFSKISDKDGVMVEGRKFGDFKLLPKENDSYYPKYSAMLNSEKINGLIGFYGSWKEYLVNFIQSNYGELLDFITK